METEFGIKKLTKETWLQPDDAAKLFFRANPDGTISRLSGEDWIASLLVVELPEKVPEDVRRLFAVARGAMAYGCFFYPLFTLGLEHSFRVLEAALTVKCQQLGGRGKQKSWKDKLRLLVAQGAISDPEAAKWDAKREFRNLVCHPDFQQILPPAVAIGILTDCANLISLLFANHAD